MEQDEREVLDLPDGMEKEQGGDDAPVPGGVAGAEGGLARGAASSEQDGGLGAGNGGCHAAAGSESDEDKDLEAIFASEASTEELEGVPPVGNAARGDAPGSGRNEDIYFELRGFRPTRRAVMHAMPPSSYRHLPLRSRKQYSPSRFIFAGGDAASSGIANADDPGTGTSEAASAPLPIASLGSTSATSRYAGASAMPNAGHGAKNEATVSTATRRSEIDVAVDKACSDDLKTTESKDEEAARTSSSCRHPSRSRKQRRPDRGISDDPEVDAAAAARAKARRGNVVLDRFLTYLVRTSPEQRPEWVRNVTADDVGVQGQHGSNVANTASGSGPEGPPDGGAGILAIVAILGASLALSLVSCVLFYIVGQRTASGLPDTYPKK